MSRMGGWREEKVILDAGRWRGRRSRSSFSSFVSFPSSLPSQLPQHLSNLSSPFSLSSSLSSSPTSPSPPLPLFSLPPRDGPPELARRPPILPSSDVRRSGIRPSLARCDAHPPSSSSSPYPKTLGQENRLQGGSDQRTILPGLPLRGLQIKDPR